MWHFCNSIDLASDKKYLAVLKVMFGARRRTLIIPLTNKRYVRVPLAGDDHSA